MTPATLELIWDAPDDVTLYAETPCGQGQLSESSPGRKVYTFPGSVAGKYFFRIFYYGCSVFGQPAAPPANITGTLTLGSDTPIVFHGTVQPRTYCMGAPNWFEFTYVHTTPYVSLSDFYLVPDKSFITTAQGTGFSYSAYGGCISTRWYPERDPITLTIVSGSEFGKFAVGDNPALVTTVTLLVSELPNVRFIPSGRFAPDGVVTIEVRCLSLVSACELQVRYCSILLGETKYFYEVEGGGSETRPWMKIYEAVSPELPSGAQVDGVWTVRESGAEPNQGQRLGVYWEQEKPIPNGSGTLPVGMVRVVGRYWHPDSIYTVDLIATKRVWWMGSQGTIGYRVPIEVKKPEKLGDSHRTMVSVFGGDPFNLDEFIVKHAGENGIPPQMIKGHVEKETHFENAFRYEPFEDISIQNDNERKNKFITLLPFVVTEAGMGGDFPTGHKNVSPTYYESTPQKIGQFMEDHLERYVNRSKKTVIGKKEYTEELTKDLRRIYKEVVKLGLKGKDPANFAIEVVKNNFYWKEYGDDYDNMYAQTRISTSYGLTQMLYATAVSSNFKETGSRYAAPNSLFMERSKDTLPPEKLNEHEFLFPRYADLMLQRLRKSLGKPQTIPDHEWNGGFERIWMNSFQRHNPGEVDYGRNVLSMSKNYLPKQQGK